MGYWYWLTVNPNIKRVKRCRKIARRMDTEPAAFFSVLSHAKTRRISTSDFEELQLIFCDVA